MEDVDKVLAFYRKEYFSTVCVCVCYLAVSTGRPGNFSRIPPLPLGGLPLSKHKMPWELHFSLGCPFSRPKLTFSSDSSQSQNRLYSESSGDHHRHCVLVVSVVSGAFISNLLLKLS